MLTYAIHVAAAAAAATAGAAAAAQAGTLPSGVMPSYQAKKKKP
jgi:hypothetical protein